MRVIYLLPIILFLLVPARASAQDLEPRAFSNTPVGMNFLAAVYAYSFGNILFDSSVPIDNASADVNSMTLAYVRSIDFFGKSGKARVLLPLVTGDWQGNLAGIDTSTSRTGAGDPRVRLTVSFVGAPALEGKGFVAYRPGTVIGADLEVIVPLGEYDPSKIINLGSNRWTFKPRVGISQTIRKWTLEAFASAWIFTDNTDFVGEQTLAQEPIFAVSGHAIYTIKRGMWLGVDGGYGAGGQTSVDGVEKATLQRNWRFGAAFAAPVGKRSALKFAYLGGTSRIGAAFDSVIVMYQYRWGGGF